MIQAVRNLGRPVGDNGINDGLIAWWQTVPNRKGGVVWQDMFQRRHAALGNSYTRVLTPYGPGIRSAVAGAAGTASGNVAYGLTSFSVEVLFTIASVNFASCHICYSYDNAIGDGFYMEMNGNATASNRMNFRRRISYADCTATSNAAVSTTAYTHAVGTCNAAGLTTLYINGVAQTITATAAGSLTNTSSTLLCAENDGTRIQTLVFARVYNTCLAQSQINRLYSQATRHKQRDEWRTFDRRTWAFGSGGGGAAPSANRRRRMLMRAA